MSGVKRRASQGLARPQRTSGTRRTVAAEATRRHVVATAGRLFLERGYLATRVDDLAREAGVAVQTIYNSVGPKPTLLSAYLDLLAAGEEAPTPVPAFMERRTREAPNAAARIALLADWFADVNRRTAALWQVLAQAAAADPAIAALATSRALQRLRNYGKGMAIMGQLGELRPGLEPEQAAALVWSVGHPQTYQLLVGDAGWPPGRYRDWVAETLARALLAADAPPV